MDERFGVATDEFTQGPYERADELESERAELEPPKKKPSSHALHGSAQNVGGGAGPIKVSVVSPTSDSKKPLSPTSTVGLPATGKTQTKSSGLPVNCT